MIVRLYVDYYISNVGLDNTKEERQRIWHDADKLARHYAESVKELCDMYQVVYNEYDSELIDAPDWKPESAGDSGHKED